MNRIFKNTIDIYCKALAFLVDVYEEEWESIESIANKQKRFNEAERLIHSTKSNTAVYDFDTRFHKIPSYLRRDLVNTALGIISSYKSSLTNWEESDRADSRPKLQKKHLRMPVFFKDNMYQETESDARCRLKLFHKNDWIWVTVILKKTDVDYLKKHWGHAAASAPRLEKRHGKYFLRFSYDEDVKLSSSKIKDQKICSVDLGINTDAVCSIMHSDGTVAASKFINIAAEKDHLHHVLNRIRKFQRQHGSRNSGSFWAYTKRLNSELAKKIANEIVSFAAAHSVDVIVFEYLDMKGKKHGTKKQKLHMWRKNYIQDVVKHKAHHAGIRISRVCARYTSRLAFNGSGEVDRDAHNSRLCTFKNGKRYNCDLSASYNIGTRYFIRELIKPVSAKRQSLLLANPVLPEFEPQ